MWSQVLFIGKGAEMLQKHSSLSPSEAEKGQQFMELTRRGKPNDVRVAHRPVIHGFTVLVGACSGRPSVLGVSR